MGKAAGPRGDEGGAGGSETLCIEPPSPLRQQGRTPRPGPCAERNGPDAKGPTPPNAPWVRRPEEQRQRQSEHRGAGAGGGAPVLQDGGLLAWTPATGSAPRAHGCHWAVPLTSVTEKSKLCSFPHKESLKERLRLKDGMSTARDLVSRPGEPAQGTAGHPRRGRQWVVTGAVAGLAGADCQPTLPPLALWACSPLWRALGGVSPPR